MSKKKEYDSIQNFKKEVLQLEEFIESLKLSALFVRSFKTLKEKVGSSKNMDKLDFVEKYSLINKDNKNSQYIYELCFIRLFATFETFSFEFLKDLYRRYPESIPKDKKLTVSEVLKRRSVQSIKEFVVDSVAIDNSYDIHIWEKTLINTFGISLFEDPLEREYLQGASIIRNSILHSGSRVSSKVLRDLTVLFKAEKAIKEKKKFGEEKLDLDRKFLFEHFLGFTKIIVQRLESTNA